MAVSESIPASAVVSATASNVSTPPSSTCSGDEQTFCQPFVLAHGGTQVVLQIAADVQPGLSRLVAAFVRHLDAINYTTTSEATLLARFVAYAAKHGRNSASVKALLQAFHKDFLDGSDIHSLAAKATREDEQQIIRSYLTASCFDGCARISTPPSALFNAAATGSANVLFAFGGQGIANPDCLDELRSLYRLYKPLVQSTLHSCSMLLERLSSESQYVSVFQDGPITLEQWVRQSIDAPTRHNLATAPYSVPLIGVIGLLNYAVTCKLLGMTPGALRSRLAATTGHSQGIAVAAAVAAANSWGSFEDLTALIVETLFRIGVESHLATPASRLPLHCVDECVSAAHGHPSSLLAVRGLSRRKLDKTLAKLNACIDEDEHIYIALANDPYNFVLGGPAHSLYGARTHLISIAAVEGEVQNRKVFDKRKPVIQIQFLPISAPFHTQYLADAAEKVKQDMSSRHFPNSQLALPVFHTRDGHDLRTSSSNVSVLDDIVHGIMTDFADWDATISSSDVSHFVTFGTGRISELVHRMKDGAGIRVICASNLGTSTTSIGHKQELFATSLPSAALQPQSWLQKFAPRLEQSANGDRAISTRLTRLLGVPHVTVAAMTPTTVPYDVVSAIMNAGYHAELAGGGYHNQEDFSDAVEKLCASIQPGRGVTCNLIYSSPRSMAWQIPALSRLVKRGLAVDGLSIGAGVPSPDVAKSYIETLGLRHITLKPGSVESVREVLNIADAFPEFPIILQWTGGRGGGHHSYEDFHTPLLELYAEIRRRDNVVLVAGSGFGGADDTYPYLSGSWSLEFGRPAMPLDGVMLGSRMMVAREAHTSPQAKELICQTPGVKPDEWTSSYDRPTGGVLTVKSEMGQPIHKIATRAVLLWAEMDKIFALPKEKASQQIRTRKAYIIKRLNADFAKPYFGCNHLGEPIDLDQMTYAEVIARLVKLMYVSQQSRWVHSSYESLVCDIINRILERFPAACLNTPALEQLSDPLVYVNELITAVPALSSVVLQPDDVDFFLQRCQAKGTKPVNFVPVIDEQLEHWMKKDSLWQSEDVDAVYGQDVQRVCILQGPVAVRMSTRTDESCRDILDGIISGHMKMLQTDTRVTRYLPDEPTTLRNEHSTISKLRQGFISDVSACSPAIQALCKEESILRSGLRVTNPLRRVLKLPLLKLYVSDGGRRLIVSQGKAQAASTDAVAAVSTDDNKTVTVLLPFVKPGDKERHGLQMVYNYHPERPFDTIEETGLDNGRAVKQLYQAIWLQQAIEDDDYLLGSYRCAPIKLTKDFLRQVSLALADHDVQPGGSTDSAVFPLDAAIVIAWDAVVKPLLLDNLDGNLLELVHLSNESKYSAGAVPFKVGDVVSCVSRVQAVTIDSPGKTIEVHAELFRDGHCVATVTSAFLFRGVFKDYSDTFRNMDESEIDVAIDSPVTLALLQDRSWLKLDPASLSHVMVGTILHFKLHTTCAWKDAETYSKMLTTGTISVLAGRGQQEKIVVGAVDFEGHDCTGNPVMDFLRRSGKLASSVEVPLPKPGWDGDAEYHLVVPHTNQPYSVVSRDCNPIHTAPAFAAWAGLPGTITHGMHTSALVRSKVENVVAGGDRLRFRSFSSTFTGMVLPGDELNITIKHIAMVDGALVLDVTAFQQRDGEQVLQGKAVIEQPSTAYVFTGQGSQSQAMGMQLYESSDVAKKVWDNADSSLMATYGWSILKIVRENPKSITVHFGGKRGRQIRKNYLQLTISHRDADGNTFAEPIVKGLTETTASYTFTEPRGLLFSTQFAQPAILLAAKATFADMQARGLIPASSSFAGHSLGEYCALSAFTDFVPFHTLLDIVFYRGLTMQIAMDRDEHGSTGFSMVAVSPSRVGKSFTEASLRALTQFVSSKTTALLEIVNYNVAGEQYVCAGSLRNLRILGTILDKLTASGTPALFADFATASDEDKEKTTLGQLALADIEAATTLTGPIELTRGKATIPLQGIDVPFHSTYLRPSVHAYRTYLSKRLSVETIVPDAFIDKWVPNVMATPFALDKDYFEEAARLTGSEVLSQIVSGLA